MRDYPHNLGRHLTYGFEPETLHTHTLFCRTKRNQGAAVQNVPHVQTAAKRSRRRTYSSLAEDRGILS